MERNEEAKGRGGERREKEGSFAHPLKLKVKEAGFGSGLVLFEAPSKKLDGLDL
ncbi:hypothetical protein Dimus_020970, partial [Dionaea muscipula]